MRYYKVVLVLMLGLTTLIGGKVLAENQIDLNITDELLVIVDNEQVTFPDQKPFIDENNRTLIPVRFPSEAFGADVDWVGEEDKVVVEQDDNGRIVKMWINNKEINVNGDPRQMDTAPVIENGRTMVPTRFVAEALGVDVEYERIEGRGVVFNFTEGQTEEEKEQIMEQIREEIEEKTDDPDPATDVTPSTEQGEYWKGDIVQPIASEEPQYQAIDTSDPKYFEVTSELTDYRSSRISLEKEGDMEAQLEDVRKYLEFRFWDIEDPSYIDDIIDKAREMYNSDRPMPPEYFYTTSSERDSDSEEGDIGAYVNMGAGYVGVNIYDL